MSIATEIERLQNAKTSIKTAIENKGVEVGDGLIDTYADKINEISAGGTTAKITDGSYLFNNNARLDNLYELLDLCENITNARYMFAQCSTLNSLDLSNLDTSKVINMEYMFNGCIYLTELDLSSLDVGNLTNTYNMFYGCQRLEKANLSGWNTSNLTNITAMFQANNKLKEVNLSGWDTSNVTKCNNMFYYCSVITDLDLSSFDLSECAYVENMLAYCGELVNFSSFRNLGKGFKSTNSNFYQYTFNVSNNTKMSHDSLLDLITNGLYDLNLTYDVANGGTLSTQKLVLGSTNMAKLTADEIAIATNKGWTVS